MMTNTTLFILCLVLFVISQGVVQIIKAAKSGNGKASAHTIQNLEDDIARQEEETEELRQRIIVLEKIVTDRKYELHREINDLANG